MSYYSLGCEVHSTETYSKIATAVDDVTANMLVSVLNAAQQLGAVDVAASRGFCANHQTIYDTQMGCPACPPRN